MIPKLFGAEVKKDLSVSTNNSIRKNWNEASFLEEMKQTVNGEQYEKLKEFYDFSKKNMDYFKWGSGKVGAYSGGILSLSQKSLFTLKSDGTLSFNIGWHKNSEDRYLPFVKPFMEDLREIGFDLDAGEPKQHYFFYNVNEWLPMVDDLKSIFNNLVSS